VDRRPALNVNVFLRLLQVAGVVGALIMAILAYCNAPPTPEEVADKNASQRAAHELEIRGLLADEATAARERDIDRALRLYSEDAVVRDARGPSWSGHTEIRGRYSELPLFKKIDHVDVSVEVSIGGQFASARASTTGLIMNEDGTETPISSIMGEIWVFHKIEGTWKILSFTYNAQLECP